MTPTYQASDKDDVSTVLGLLRDSLAELRPVGTQHLVPPNHLWRDASRLGQQCRAAGFNASSLDLIIAALCIHHDAELITFDADYLAIARVSKLHVHHLSRPLGL